MQTEQLTQTLIEQTNQIITQLIGLQQYDMARLTWRANPESWNILECVQHLNLYGNFYLPQIQQKISRSATQSEPTFSSGWLGNYFAESMLPKQKLNKMKTFKDKNPLNARLDKMAIEHSLQQQVTLLQLLNQSRSVSLTKVKIATSISSLLKLSLGDTFRFYINHMTRHMQQIKNIQATQEGQQATVLSTENRPMEALHH